MDATNFQYILLRSAIQFYCENCEHVFKIRDALFSYNDSRVSVSTNTLRICDIMLGHLDAPRFDPRLKKEEQSSNKKKPNQDGFKDMDVIDVPSNDDIMQSRIIGVRIDEATDALIEMSKSFVLFGEAQKKLESNIRMHHWVLGDQVWKDGFDLIVDASNFVKGPYSTDVDALEYNSNSGIWKIHSKLSNSLRSAVHKSEFEELTSHKN